MRILVTGGCGFIGSHLVDELVKKHSVKVLDSLEYQVHEGKLPDYLNPDAKYIFGDIRDKETLERAIEDVDVYGSDIEPEITNRFRKGDERAY